MWNVPADNAPWTFGGTSGGAWLATPSNGSAAACGSLPSKVKKYLVEKEIDCYALEQPLLTAVLACGTRGLVYVPEINACTYIEKAETMSRMRAPVSSVGAVEDRNPRGAFFASARPAVSTVGEGETTTEALLPGEVPGSGGTLPPGMTTSGVDLASTYYQAYGIPAPGSSPATPSAPAAGTPVPGFPGLFIPAFPGAPASGTASPAGLPAGAPAGAVPGYAVPGMPGFYIPAVVPAGLPGGGTSMPVPAPPPAPPTKNTTVIQTNPAPASYDYSKLWLGIGIAAVLGGVYYYSTKKKG